MLISVIVPIYNVEKYLVRCIKSIISQTYTVLEIILVNDGSPDNSLLICDEYAKLDKRIRVISQHNKGLSGARNAGIKIAKGEYICFIDSDDFIEDKMIESYVKIATQFHPDVILTNIFQYQKGNKIFTEIRNNLPYENLLNREGIVENLVRPYYGGDLGIIPSACTKLYSTVFLSNNNLHFDETLKRSEDYWFNFFVFQQANFAYAINQSFYHYYSNEGSMIKSFREGQFDAFLNNRKKLLNEHRLFDFPINWKVLDSQFVRNVNELIVLQMNAQGFMNSYRSIQGYLDNEEFLKFYANSSLPKKHNKLIKFFLSHKMSFLAIIVFFLWSLKAK